MERVYRDALEAVWARLRALEHEVAEREARVTPAFWVSLPVERARALRALSVGAVPLEREQSLEALLATQQSLVTYRDALDAALADLPALESAWTALPDAAPVPDLGADAPRRDALSLNVEIAVALLGERLRTVTLRHDRGAVVEALGDVGHTGRFRVGATPVVLVATVAFAPQWWAREAAGVRVAIATSVSPGTPRLCVRPEGMAEGLARAFRLRRSTSLGDPEFDAFFQVEATPEAARAVLTPPVRAALRVIAREDVPTLSVGDGAAEIRWSFDPTPVAVAAAVRALTSLRETVTPAPLRRDPVRRG